MTKRINVEELLKSVPEALRYRHVKGDIPYTDKFPIIHAMMIQEFEDGKPMTMHKKPVPVNRLTPFLVVKPCSFKLTTELDVKDKQQDKVYSDIFLEENGTESIMYVQFKTSLSAYTSYLGNAFLKCRGDVYGSKDGETWECITATKTSEECERILFAENGDLRDGIIVYNYPERFAGMLTSSGMMKEGTAVLLAENEEGFDIDLVCRALFHGMDDEYMHYAPTYTTNVAKKRAQASTRMGQIFASCWTTIPLRSFAIYCGKIEDDNGFSFNDGEGWVSARFFAEAVSELTGQEVSEDDCVGVHGQMRPYSCKGKMGAIRTSMMRDLIMNTPWTEETIDVVTISRADLPKYSRIINDAMELKSGELAGKVVVILEEGETIDDCAMFADFNVIKAPVDWTDRDGLNILKVSHPFEGDKGKAKTSTQMIVNLAAANLHDTIAFCRELAADDVCRLGEKYANTVGKPLGEDFATMDPTLAAIQINPGILHAYEPVFKSVLNKDVEGICSRINSLKWEINGFDAYVTPDIGKYFGIKLLEDDEVYCRGLVLAGKERAMLKKYPSMHMLEYHLVKSVDAATIMERAILAGLSEERIHHLMDYLDTLEPRTIMVGANPRLLNLLAGMDFDGDTIVIITDERVLHIIDKQTRNPLAVCF